MAPLPRACIYRKPVAQSDGKRTVNAKQVAQIARRHCVGVRKAHNCIAVAFGGTAVAVKKRHRHAWVEKRWEPRRIGALQETLLAHICLLFTRSVACERCTLRANPRPDHVGATMLAEKSRNKRVHDACHCLAHRNDKATKSWSNKRSFPRTNVWRSDQRNERCVSQNESQATKYMSGWSL